MGDLHGTRRRQRWPGLKARGGLCALLLGLVALGQSPRITAQAPTTPTFENVTLILGGYQTFARATGTGEQSVVALAELLRDGEVLARDRQRSSPAGDLELAFVSTGPRARRPIAIRPGDRVSLSPEPEPPHRNGTRNQGHERPAATWTAGTIEAIVDADGVLSGVAPPGQRVTITAANAEGGFASARTSADELGAWSVELAEELAVGPGTTGTALYVEDGVVHQRNWAWRSVRVRVGDPVIEVVDRAGARLGVEIQRHGGGTPEQPVRDFTAVGQGSAVVWRGGGEKTRLVAYDDAGAPVTPLPCDIVSVFEIAESRDLIATSETRPDGDVTVVRIDEALVVVDPQRSVVTGRSAYAQAPLHISAGGETTVVEPDDDGTWSAVFSDPTTLHPDTAVLVEDRSAGWALVAHARAFLGIDPLVAAVHGRGVAEDPVGLRVLRPSSGPGPSPDPDAALEEIAATTGTVNADGLWRLVALDATGSPIPLTPDTHLELDILGQTLTVPAPPLVARARASRDLVLGEAPPESVVTIEVGAAAGEEGVREQLVVDATGTWRAELEGRVDLVPGSPVRVRVWPPGGLPAELTFPVFRASVQSHGDRVRIEGWPGLASTVRMERGGKLVATAACTVERTRCDALLQALDGGEPPRPVEGDEFLIYPEREAAVTLPMVKLAAHIDLSGADVVGASPPQEPVEITFRHDEGRATPLEARVGADDNGVFDYELAASQWDLVTPGLVADVYHPRPGGHRLFATGVMESVRAWVGEARVSGVAEPGTTVAASLHVAVADAEEGVGAGSGSPATLGHVLASVADGSWGGEIQAEGDSPGPVIATGTATADGLARFDLTLADAAGRPVRAEPGATLWVTHARRSLRIPIEPLAAWAVDENGAITGAAAPERRLRAIHAWPREDAELSTPEDGEDLEYLHEPASSDLAGTWHVPAPREGRERPARSTIAVEQDDGVELRRAVDARGAPGVLWLPTGLTGR